MIDTTSTTTATEQLRAKAHAILCGERPNVSTVAREARVWRSELSGWLHGHRSMTAEKIERVRAVLGIEAQAEDKPRHRHQRRRAFRQ